MFKKLTWLLFVVLLSTPALALAHGEHSKDEGSMSVEDRLQALEADQAELYHSLEGKKSAGLASRLTDMLTISGLLEIEAGVESVDLEDGSSDSSSDLVLATAQLGFGIELNENVGGDIILLYEEDETPLDVDEAAIKLSFGALSSRIGLQYVPFGNYYSHFISDPLTLELGETREIALLVGYEFAPVTVSLFLFNGDVDEIGDEDHIEDWGASLTLAPMDGLELGASWISDLADSDAEILGDADQTDQVAGWSVFAVAELGSFGFSAEALGAVEEFDDLDADGDGNGDEPLTWNVEVSYAVLENVEIAARLEGSDEFAGQPERQYGLAGSWGPWENVSLALEYLHGEFEAGFGVDDDGNQLDSRDLVTTQLALEF